MGEASAEAAMDVDNKGKDASSIKVISVQERLAANVQLIEKAVKQKETRTLFSKLIRITQAIRKELSAHDVQVFVRSTLPTSLASSAAIVEHLQQVPATTTKDNGSADTAELVLATSDPLPEVEIYAYYLALLILIDNKQWPAARSLSSLTIDRLTTFNRRTLDVLGSRIFFYYSYAAEKSGALAEIRSSLLALHRSAVLHHDDIGQETLLNLLLRNYLAFNLYDQAEALRAKAQRDTYRSSHQHSRLLFYQGQIRAVRLEYSDARDALTQALRKAPAPAHGFRATVTKWLVVVRLLLGEVPDRAELVAPELHGALGVYLDLAATVRAGDLSAFASVASRHVSTFKADGTVHLVSRLRANVIRAGLRRIAAAYSRISLADVAAKLGLASTEDAEFVVAKSIRDGGISAMIDHDNGIVVAAAGADVYSTDEPLAAFHARIAFCMDVRNEAQRAMRYQMRPQHHSFEEANEAREKQEQELTDRKSVV